MGFQMKKSIRLNFGYCACAVILTAIISTFPETTSFSAVTQDMKSYSLDPPAKALISPSGAHLECSVERPIISQKGYDMLSFVIPADAANLQLLAPGRTIIRYESVPVALNMESVHSGYRQSVRQKEMELNARLETVKANSNLLAAVPAQMSSQDMTQRQHQIQENMPALALEKEKLERDLALVREELSRMPEPGVVGSQIMVLLEPQKEAAKTARVNFSYDISMCGWQAVYNFDASPDNSKEEIVDVRLLAEVWQYTGIDWDNTEITLVTSGSGPRQPWALPDWVIGTSAPQPKPLALGTEHVASKLSDTAAVANFSVKAPPVAPVHANSNDVYASWKLSARGLPEGRSRLQIIADAWKAPLQWLARPSREDNRVWLLAKYVLPPGQAWPSGTAQYNVNGQSVGKGHFNPAGGEATLYFGPDPRVSVRTTFDSSKQGETGIINTSKTWSWAWTYTLTNQHNRPIKVRVERPAPMITNEDITVSYQNKPVAQIDNKEHLVWWLVDVPGNGKAVIEHGVTIAAPEKLSLLPDAP